MIKLLVSNHLLGMLEHHYQNRGKLLHRWELNKWINTNVAVREAATMMFVFKQREFYSGDKTDTDHQNNSFSHFFLNFW